MLSVPHSRQFLFNAESGWTNQLETLRDMKSASSSHTALFGKSVFVTGHTGFKGPWLCHWLDYMGARTTGFALSPPTEPNNFTVSGVRETLVGHHEGDIRDFEKLREALAGARPELVIHLAAQTVVREGYRSPRETWDVNILGTACLLDAIRDIGEPMAVVIVTSDKCYQNMGQVWGYRECDTLGGHDPYSASKGATELLVDCYRNSYFHPTRLHEHGVKLVTARAGNVIGGGDWTSDALIPDLFRAASGGRPVGLRYPEAIRPWEHVVDALSGYFRLAERILTSDDPSLMGAWNFGPMPGNELAVGKIADMFFDGWGKGEWTDASHPDQPHEAAVLRLSIEKAMWELNWRPQWHVQESVSRTVDWYREYVNRKGGGMAAVTRQQITDYLASSE